MYALDPVPNAPLPGATDGSWSSNSFFIPVRTHICTTQPAVTKINGGRDCGHTRSQVRQEHEQWCDDQEECVAGDGEESGEVVCHKHHVYAAKPQLGEYQQEVQGMAHQPAPACG